MEYRIKIWDMLFFCCFRSTYFSKKTLNFLPKSFSVKYGKMYIFDKCFEQIIST